MPNKVDKERDKALIEKYRAEAKAYKAKLSPEIEQRLEALRQEQEILLNTKYSDAEKALRIKELKHEQDQKLSGKNNKP